MSEDEEPVLYLLDHGGYARVVGYEDNWNYAFEMTGEAGRLFAAAPELLAALRDLVAYDEGSSDEDSYGHELLVRCRAAIAKATGKESE